MYRTKAAIETPFEKLQIKPNWIFYDFRELL